MKLKKLALLVFAALTGVSSASNISVIDFSGTTFNIVTRQDGTPMATGTGVVRIGYFLNTALASSQFLADLRSTNPATVTAALQTNFIPLGEGDGTAARGTGFGTTSGPRFANRTINSVAYTGRLAGQITNVTSVPGTPNTSNAGGVPAGTRLFLLVYSDSDTVLTGTEEFGIFGSTTWLMPADNGTNQPLNATDITAATAAVDILRGSSGSLRLQNFVPEPGTSSVMIFAALGLMARRRR